MRRILLILLLALAPARADQAFKLVQPAQPTWVLPGELVTLQVEAGPGQALRVKVPDGPDLALEEASPGHYRGCLVVNRTQSLLLVKDQEVLGPLGTLECLEAVRPALQVTRDQAIYRCGPDPDYDRYDPLSAGVRLQITGRQGDWLRVWPGEGWVSVGDVQLLPPGTAPSQARVSSIRVQEDPSQAQVRVRLGEPCAWQTREDAPSGRLWIDLPGAAMAMGETAYASDPSRVTSAILHPGPEGTSLELGVGRLWGYQLRWEAPDLVVSLPNPPARPSLEGLRITLDAGHGGSDSGAIGLNGTKEKDLNLAVAMALKAELEKAGAVIHMTRDHDTEVRPGAGPAEDELASRVVSGEQAGSQLFISIHHNARADIAEGRRSHGTHIYYYRPQSRELAQAIARPLALAIGEPSYLAFWRSFHLTRQSGMPAILIECNFVSNPTLEKEMYVKGYAEKAAGGIRQGLEAFLKEAVPGHSP